jgi:signal transduction histidine kinase
MNNGLLRAEGQTASVGRVLLGLGVVGVLAGLLSGYGTARALTRRVAELSVRVRAVQAELDQDAGALTVEGPHFEELDARLVQVVERVKDVCRRLQEQERDLLRAEQLAAVGRLAAGVAHEVRNPLAGIKLFVEVAVRPENPTPLDADDCRMILAEVGRIERTVQDLLDYARTPPPIRRPHDLRELVREAVGAANGRADRKGITVRADLPDSPVPAAVDHDQVLSLLTNLLYNGIDAAPPGGDVFVRTISDPTGLNAVEVTDTGAGIDPSVADRLFTPFATTKPTGTGLGLTVARRIAEDHGGTLTAANRPGGGACFTFTLPAGADARAETSGR